MGKEQKNFAYIDGANLHKALKELGWQLDYKRFRVWLSDKYDIKEAYIFIGFISAHKNLYTHLRRCNFALIFKEVVYDESGKAKGNCDADLVLRVAQDAYEERLQKAVIVSSDGDYASLVRFLKERGQLRIILSPGTSKKCSILLKRTNVPIAYLNDQRSLLGLQKRKTPGTDKPRKGSSRSE